VAAPATTNASSPAATTSAQAAPDNPNSDARFQARQRFDAGMKLYEEGDYALALLEFERAHSLVPGYRVLYNIGQVNIQLGRYARATRKLRQYLAEGSDQIPDDRKASVLADLDMLAGRTATLLVVVNVPDAEIVLDGDILATSPMLAPMLVDAGEHRLTVRKHGYVDQARPIAMAGRDQLRLELVLAEAPKVVPVEKTIVVERPESPEPNARSSSRQLTLALGWTGTGLLAAAWVTTGYIGLSTASERKDKLDQATSATELNDLKHRARNWYLAADICGGLTLTATAMMVYYTFFVPRPAATRQITVGLTPNSVQVLGRF
jgi:tetratricopeptide (TPR) repeat protein